MRYIENAWQSYCSMVMPADAGEIQIKETRQAFFAGVAILFQTMMVSLDPGEEPTDRDMQRLSDLQDELDEFGALIDKRLLQPGELH